VFKSITRNKTKSLGQGFKTITRNKTKLLGQMFKSITRNKAKITWDQVIFALLHVTDLNT
jgi:hypothetical protein